jgi:hypothetical protein
MSRQRILAVEDVAQIIAWLAAYQGVIGTAVDASGQAWSLAGTSGGAFTVPTNRPDVVAAVVAALGTRKIWADQGTATAKALRNGSRLDVATFDRVFCVQTLRAVLRPGTLPPKRPTAAPAAAGSVAREVTEMHAAHPIEERRLALESVRQDVLWRPRQVAGMTLDVAMLKAETSRVWKLKSELAKANGVDLTADTDEVLAWVAAAGITIVDRDGQPTLSRDYFDGAVVPEASSEAWAAFRTARSLKSSMDKLMELSRAEVRGKMYPQVVIRHAVTGRGTVRRPALQNLAGKLRPLLTAAPGKVLVSLDIARCEVMLAAAMSGDTALAAALNAGDPYVALVVAQFGEDRAGDAALRAQFKRALIASLYGQGAASLAVALKISETEAKELKSGLKRQWPRVFEWIAENTAAAKAGVAGRTLTGRPTPVLEATAAFKRTNHVVQGSGADFLYRGVARVAERLGPEVLYLTVHDELVLEVNPEGADEACRVLVESMTFELPGGLVLTGDAQVLGTSWGK